MLQINCIYIDLYLVQITYAEQACPTFRRLVKQVSRFESFFQDFIAEDPNN